MPLRVPRSSVQRLVLTNTDCSAKSVQVLSDTLVNSLFVCNIHTLILDNNPVSQKYTPLFLPFRQSARQHLHGNVDAHTHARRVAYQDCQRVLRAKSCTSAPAGEHKRGDVVACTP